MAKMMLNVVRKFCDSSQSTSLSDIQIVIFDSSMFDGFARALQAADKSSKSLWDRTKRKSSEVLDRTGLNYHAPLSLCYIEG